MLRLEPDATGIARAAEILRGGGVVGFPTDTVYGLAAATEAGRRRIYELKARDAGKPLVLMAAGPGPLADRARFNGQARGLAERFWPGPLTLVLPAEGGGTVGLRVPDHPLARALLEAAGPLWTTSANLSGRPELLTAADVIAELPGVDGVLDGGSAPGGTPSTVVDLTGTEPRLLREGALTAAELGLR